MQHDQAAITLRPLEALLVIVILLGGISFSIVYYGVEPHTPIILSIFLLLIYGLCKKVSFKDLESGLVEGAKSGLGAVFLFFFIGMLISSWMASGTIPTFIYLALEMVNGKYFFAVVFIVTSMIGMSIGSSLTTIATLGVVFISVSSALDLSTPVTAGAVISGAFFGDKMSPLSDTTNLASMTVKVDLFEHIKNIMWTTVPAFIISLVLFSFLSPSQAATNLDNIALLRNALMELQLVHWYSLIPFVLLAILAIKRVPAILALSFGTLSAVAISLFIQKDYGLGQVMTLLYSGYKSNSGVEELDSLLTRGGMESMLFSISLVLLALAMGGLLFKLGILPALLEGIQQFLTRIPLLIGATALASVGVNYLVGEQYLSILLPGNAFQESYAKAGLHPKNLSRVLEDAGTVVNPLVPWSVCGVFITSVLGIPTTEYFPFAFFCLLSPLLTIFFGITGWTITKVDKRV